MKYSLLTFTIEYKLNARDAEKLRGFFANRYRDVDWFHNHDEAGKDLYRYPRIQYRIINGMPAILGLDEGAELVKDEFIKIDKLNISGQELAVKSSSLDYKTEEIAVNDALYEYRFETLWLGLNEKNHELYKTKKLDLNMALTNNLLSDLKGLGIWTDKRILVKGNFRPREVILDNHKMTGFYGEFTTNVLIPDYLGTGKRKSIGFGVIVGKKEGL